MSRTLLENLGIAVVTLALVFIACWLAWAFIPDTAKDFFHQFGFGSEEKTDVKKSSNLITLDSAEPSNLVKACWAYDRDDWIGTDSVVVEPNKPIVLKFDKEIKLQPELKKIDEILSSKKNIKIGSELYVYSDSKKAWLIGDSTNQAEIPEDYMRKNLILWTSKQNLNITNSSLENDVWIIHNSDKIEKIKPLFRIWKSNKLNRNEPETFAEWTEISFYDIDWSVNEKSLNIKGYSSMDGGSYKVSSGFEKGGWFTDNYYKIEFTNDFRGIDNQKINPECTIIKFRVN